MTNVCTVCKIEFESVKPAKTCSAKCRVTLSRFGVTHGPNVTLAEVPVTLDVTFDFYTINKANGLGRPNDEKSPVKTVKYWYEVPLGAIPVIKKGWPEMPDYMNGRQYFLWWKNNFETQDKEGNAGQSGAVLHNPFPTYEKLEYFKAGDNSRRWGA